MLVMLADSFLQLSTAHGTWYGQGENAGCGALHKGLLTAKARRKLTLRVLRKREEVVAEPVMTRSMLFSSRKPHSPCLGSSCAPALQP